MNRKGLFGMALVNVFAIFVLITVLIAFYFLFSMPGVVRKEMISSLEMSEWNFYLTNFLRTPLLGRPEVGYYAGPKAILKEKVNQILDDYPELYEGNFADFIVSLNSLIPVDDKNNLGLKDDIFKAVAWWLLKRTVPEKSFSRILVDYPPYTKGGLGDPSRGDCEITIAGIGPTRPIPDKPEDVPMVAIPLHDSNEYAKVYFFIMVED